MTDDLIARAKEALLDLDGGNPLTSYEASLALSRAAPDLARAFIRERERAERLERIGRRVVFSECPIEMDSAVVELRAALQKDAGT